MKRWLVGGGVVLALIVAGWGYHWWNSSSSTNVAFSPKNDSSVLGSQTRLQPWQTTYFSTEYPSSLRVRTSTESPNKAVVGNYMLSGVVTQDEDQVGVTVVHMGNNTLAGESAVKYRLQHPELYTLSSRAYAPSGAYVFNGTTGYEAGIFWQSNDNFAAVVVSGSTTRQAELEQDLQAIVSNWQWQ